MFSFHYRNGNERTRYFFGLIYGLQLGETERIRRRTPRLHNISVKGVSPAKIRAAYLARKRQRKFRASYCARRYRYVNATQ